MHEQIPLELLTQGRMILDFIIPTVIARMMESKKYAKQIENIIITTSLRRTFNYFL